MKTGIFMYSKLCITKYFSNTCTSGYCLSGAFHLSVYPVSGLSPVSVNISLPSTNIAFSHGGSFLPNNRVSIYIRFPPVMSGNWTWMELDVICSSLMLISSEFWDTDAAQDPRGVLVNPDWQRHSPESLSHSSFFSHETLSQGSWHTHSTQHSSPPGWVFSTQLEFCSEIKITLERLSIKNIFVLYLLWQQPFRFQTRFTASWLTYKFSIEAFTFLFTVIVIVVLSILISVFIPLTWSVWGTGTVDVLGTWWARTNRSVTHNLTKIFITHCIYDLLVLFLIEIHFLQ